jgi:mRNA-degrading endonuclease RelE of RelBE toxin-antitoxin system
VVKTDGRETGTRTAVREAIERQAPRTMAAQNRPFKVWYEINEEQKKVTLRAVLHKDEAKKYY